MAFHFFLSLLPLFVFIGYLVGSIARKKGVENVLAPLLESLPDNAEAVVKKEVLRLAGADTLGPLAAFGFLWVAGGGTHGLMDSVEGLVGAPPRPWWKKRVLAMLWVLTSLLAVGVASLGIIQWDEVFHGPEPAVEGIAQPVPVASPGVSGGAAPSASGNVSAHPPPRARPHPPRRKPRMLRSDGERALAGVLSLAGAVGGLAAFYWFSISHSSRVKRRVFPGAVLAVGLWLVITWGFSLYVATLATCAVFYGSLAAVAVLLIWLWLTSMAILVGAELNSQLEGLRD